VPGLNDPSVIDLVMINAERSEVILIVVETEPWADRPDLNSLNQKLNSYLTFALDGAMESTYPEARGLGIRIQFDLYFSPSEPAQSDLAALAEALQNQGMQFTLNVRENPGQASA
jgi:hypothetical protein